MLRKLILDIAKIAIDKHLELERIRSELNAKSKAEKSLIERANKLNQEAKTYKDALSKHICQQNIKKLKEESNK